MRDLQKSGQEKALLTKRYDYKQWLELNRRGVLCFVAMLGILLIGLVTWTALAQDKEAKKDTALFYEGQEFLEQKKPEAAAEKFQELLANYPQSNIRDLAYYWLGKSYLDLGKSQEAKETLASLKKEFPTSPLVKRLEGALKTAEKTPTAPAPAGPKKEEKAKKVPPPSAPPAPPKQETAQAPPLESQPPAAPVPPPTPKAPKVKKSKEEIRREAIALYQKIIRESPDSPEAAKARQRLTEMGVEIEAKKLPEQQAPPVPQKPEVAQAPQPEQPPATPPASPKQEVVQAPKQEPPRPMVPAPPPRTAPTPSKGFFLIITQVADLKVEGRITKVSAYPGDTALVPFTVANSGNAEDSFSLEATLPSEFQAAFFTDTDGDGQIGPNEKQITATPPLAIGQTYPVLLRIRLPQTMADGQKKEFDIRVASNYDPNIAQLLKQTVVSSGPRLAPEFRVDKQRVKPGDTVQYSLNLTNAGSAEARDIKLQYSYHPSLIFLSANPIPDRIEQATRSLTWNIKALAPQATMKAEVNFKVGDEVMAGQQILNRGSLESAVVGEPGLIASPGVVVEQVAAVKVEGSREEVPTTPGDLLFLPFKVKNQGNGPDSFSLRLEGGEVSGAELFLDQNGDGMYQPGEPQVTETPKLGSHEAALLLLKVQVPVKKTDGQRTELTVSATSKLDFNISSKASKFLVYSLPIVNLSTQLASSNSIPGGVISYQLTAFNSGTGIARDLVISDLLPAELEYVNADPAPADRADHQLVWTLPELGPNQKKVLVVSVRTRPGLHAGTVIQKETRIRYKDLNGNSYE